MYVGHADVVIGNVLDEAATPIVRFDTNAVVRPVYRAVDDGDVGHATFVGITADGNPVAVTISIVGEENARGPTAAGEIIVAHADVAVLNQDVRPADIARVRVVRRRIGRGRRRPNGDA